MHVANQQHQAAAVLFTHLQKMEASIEEEKRAYNCTLCKFSSPGKPALMGHVRTMKHLQMEQIHQLQKRAEGNTSHTEIGDIFQVTENAAIELEYSSERPNNNDDPRGKFMFILVVVYVGSVRVFGRYYKGRHRASGGLHCGWLGMIIWGRHGGARKTIWLELISEILIVVFFDINATTKKAPLYVHV